MTCHTMTRRFNVRRRRKFKLELPTWAQLKHPHKNRLIRTLNFLLFHLFYFILFFLAEWVSERGKNFFVCSLQCCWCRFTLGLRPALVLVSEAFQWSHWWTWISSRLRRAAATKESLNFFFKYFSWNFLLPLLLLFWPPPKKKINKI